MSVRAGLIGFVLVLLICGLNYLSMHIFRLPNMINGGMPVIVFATLVLLALAVNPLLAKLRVGTMFSPAELAVILALGACVCGYTGATYFRYFGSTMTLPAHMLQTRPHWQAAQVMSYVPGHVGYVGEGHLLRPTELAQRVVSERASETAAGRLWRLTPVADRHVWREASEASDDEGRFRAALTQAVNRVLADPAFTAGRGEAGGDPVVAGRRWLQASLPEVFSPPPRGGGVLLNDGVYDSGVLEPALLGSGEQGAVPSPAAVSWRTWWPAIWLWGGLMLLLMATVICLSVIVRPQWADHERLTFPLVRFVEMMTVRQPGRWLPAMARSRLFWAGFAVTGLHLINGLHAWFPTLPHIPVTIDLTALRTLFPNASRSWQAQGVFSPTIYLTIVAFAYLLPRSISLTFGLTNFVFVLIAAQLYAHGISATGGMARTPWYNLVNFGAVLGMIVAVIYTGRHYYRQVVVGSLLQWRGSRGRASRPAIWAFRAVLVLVPVTVLHLTSSGLSLMFAVFGVAMVLLLWFVTARIVCETGLIRMGQTILPMTVATAFLGYEGVGPTNLIVLTILAVILANDLWETPMNYTVTGLEAAKRMGVPERTLAPGLLVTAVAGFGIALVTTLAVQYHFGILSVLDDLAVPYRASLPFNQATDMITDLAATDSLVASLNATGLERLAQFQFDPWVLGWTGSGLMLFGLFAVARLRLPWWPIHPLMFVLLGNWGLLTFGVSFLIGWLIRTSVSNVAGARGYHALLPLMCGVIAGGLVSAVGWMLVGLVYFVHTGLRPETYTTF